MLEPLHCRVPAATVTGALGTCSLQSREGSREGGA